MKLRFSSNFDIFERHSTQCYLLYWETEQIFRINRTLYLFLSIIRKKANNEFMEFEEVLKSLASKVAFESMEQVRDDFLEMVTDLKLKGVLEVA